MDPIAAADPAPAAEASPMLPAALGTVTVCSKLGLGLAGHLCFSL